jgi:hypothetical protein
MIFGESVRSTERFTEEKSKLDGDEGHDLPITSIFYPCLNIVHAVLGQFFSHP